MKIHGHVIKGQGIGKQFDLPPTMNIELSGVPTDLEHGIYAVWVETNAGRFGGAAHFGPRPAVHASLSFEVHCFGLNQDLYGTEVNIETVQRLREVKNFESIGALKVAIEEDVRRAKEILGLRT